jgi:hypothetical protein
MLNKVSMTSSKKLQEKQIVEVEKWFQRNFEVVDYRTKIPSFLQTSQSTRTSSVFTSPKSSSGIKTMAKVSLMSQTDSKA